jgi:chitinase
VSGVQAWTQAGFSVNQIILGVAAYGHSFSVAQSDAVNASGILNLYPPFNKANQPAGDIWDSTASGVDSCGNPNVVGGIFTFWGLISAGFLQANGTPTCGVYHTFDECSKTVRAPHRDYG